MSEEARFTATLQASSTWRYAWVLLLVVVGLLACLRPWEAAAPLAFSLRPVEPATALAAPGASAPQAIGVRILPAATPAQGASVPR